MHRLFTALAVAASVSLAALPFGAEPAASREEPDRQGPQPSQKQELLTDAAIIAAIIAASIASYKAMDKPCACPEDLMRDGKKKCGGNSAWARSGGYEPLCYPTDVTPAMIDDYRKNKKIPGIARGKALTAETSDELTNKCLGSTTPWTS